MLGGLSYKVCRTFINQTLRCCRVFVRHRGECSFMFERVLRRDANASGRIYRAPMSVTIANARYKSQDKTFRDEKNSEESDDDDEEEEEEEEKESDGEDDDTHFNQTFAEDRRLPKNFRERKAHLTSMRLDAVLSAGLTMARKKIDDCLLGSRIKLNGERVVKKSVKVKEGDYIDLAETQGGSQKTKRVRIIKIVQNDTGKCVAYLRSWKGGIERTATD